MGSHVQVFTNLHEKIKEILQSVSCNENHEEIQGSMIGILWITITSMFLSHTKDLLKDFHDSLALDTEENKEE